MPLDQRTLIPWLTRYVATLRFPKLLLLTATLFVVDLWIPDAIPFADEILLALATVLLARLTDDRSSPRP